VRRVRLVVSPSYSESGIAGPSPDEGTTHQCVTSLSKIFTGSGQQAFHPSGVDTLVPTSAGGNVLCATAGTACGYTLAAVGGCDEASLSHDTVCAAPLVVQTCSLPTCNSGAVLVSKRRFIKIAYVTFVTILLG
jgi:hypothetical protein